MTNLIEKYKEIVGKSKYIAILIPFIILTISDLILFEYFKTDDNNIVYILIIRNTRNILISLIIGYFHHKKFKECLRVNKIIQSKIVN